MMISQVSGYPDYDVFMTEQVPGPRRSKIVGRHMWTVPYKPKSKSSACPCTFSFFALGSVKRRRTKWKSNTLGMSLSTPGLVCQYCCLGWTGNLLDYSAKSFHSTENFYFVFGNPPVNVSESGFWILSKPGHSTNAIYVNPQSGWWREWKCGSKWEKWFNSDQRPSTFPPDLTT